MIVLMYMLMFVSGWRTEKQGCPNRVLFGEYKGPMRRGAGNKEKNPGKIHMCFGLINT